MKNPMSVLTVALLSMMLTVAHMACVLPTEPIREAIPFVKPSSWKLLHLNYVPKDHIKICLRYSMVYYNMA